MSISQTQITERLDDLEEALPSIPAKTVAFSRAAARRTTSVASAVIEEFTGRAGNVVTAVSTATKTTAGQARSAAERSAKSVKSGVAETTGQATAQARRAVDTIEAETASLIDDGTNAIDPAPHNPATLHDLTKAELYERARDRDVDGRAAMTKAELVAALRT